jgi:hypothetical protein
MKDRMMGILPLSIFLCLNDRKHYGLHIKCKFSQSRNIAYSKITSHIRDFHTSSSTAIKYILNKSESLQIPKIHKESRRSVKFYARTMWASLNTCESHRHKTGHLNYRNYLAISPKGSRIFTLVTLTRFLFSSYLQTTARIGLNWFRYPTISINIQHEIKVTDNIYLRLYSPLLGLGRFSSFLMFYTVGSTPWTGDQPVAMPLPAHRIT